jgi:hypothetical protein
MSRRLAVDAILWRCGEIIDRRLSIEPSEETVETVIADREGSETASPTASMIPASSAMGIRPTSAGTQPVTAPRS